MKVKIYLNFRIGSYKLRPNDDRCVFRRYCRSLVVLHIKGSKVIMRKFILVILAVLLFTNKANAQLLEQEELYPNVEREFYPNVKIIKTKSYSGTGGKGFWSIVKLDTIGRVFEKEYYRKRKLLARESFVYNSNNDILYEIKTFDINNSNRINDTTLCYEYKYQEGRIIYQKLTFCGSTNDSIIIRLIENRTDTTLVYQKKSYYFRQKTSVTDIYEKKYILNYKNGRLVSFETIDEDRKATSFLEYYSNGKLKRKKIEREPKEEFITIGGGVIEKSKSGVIYDILYTGSSRRKRQYLLTLLPAHYFTNQ